MTTLFVCNDDRRLQLYLRKWQAHRCTPLRFRVGTTCCVPFASAHGMFGKIVCRSDVVPPAASTAESKTLCAQHAITFGSFARGIQEAGSLAARRPAWSTSASMKLLGGIVLSKTDIAGLRRPTVAARRRAAPGAYCGGGGALLLCSSNTQLRQWLRALSLIHI